MSIKGIYNKMVRAGYLDDTTAAEQNFLDGATAGTQVASKAVIADANVNIGVVKATALHIGASGAEEQVNATADELNAADMSTVTLFEDFLGDALNADIVNVKAGSGTGNAVAIVAAAQGGQIEIKTASDDGVITANASALEFGGLHWKANQGGLMMEARVQIDNITDAMFFIGFTDTLPNTTLEAPIFLVAADIDSDATNACGVLYDTDGTTEEWCHGGVKADTDTVPAFNGAAPVNATWVTVRVEVSAAGAVQGFIDGTAIGVAVAAAVTITTPLCPVIVAVNRGGAARNLLVDYVWVQANR